MLGNWGLGTESANASVSKAKVLSGDSEGAALPGQKLWAAGSSYTDHILHCFCDLGKWASFSALC